MWDELHDPYSPAARCRSKLRFWVSLKVAYVFICEECRGMRTLSARRVDSTSCSSDDADDPYFMTAVSRLTPRARPADQPRTASIVPPRASADGWDGAERPAHETGLIACAARAADQLLPDPLAGRSCSRCSTGWCAAAPPAAPQRPPASHAAARLAPDRPGTPHGEGARKLLAT